MQRSPGWKTVCMYFVKYLYTSSTERDPLVSVGMQRNILNHTVSSDFFRFCTGLSSEESGAGYSQSDAQSIETNHSGEVDASGPWNRVLTVACSSSSRVERR